MKRQVKSITYDRSGLDCGILHIGVGNFHRAHMECYTDSLISLDPSASAWSICGAMLLPGDERLYKALKGQDGMYTLTVCGRNGEDEVREIGSLSQLLWSGEESEAIVEKIADPKIKIVSLTITEGGYNIDKESGEFVADAPAIVHDLENPHSPQTAFGYIAEGLRRRKENGVGGLTILSCDNLQHNGNTARKAFMSFFKLQDPQLAAWVEQNVTFPNSMVDRITPATLPADAERLNDENGTTDAAPVYCEDFIQWVVEDNFAAGRPEWEKVGVEFTDDVTAFENMKLSLLNASHTLLSYPSFLLGYRKVDAAMHNPAISAFVRRFMDIDITPYVPAPGAIDLEDYKQTLIERFGNRTVSDQISRLCFDGVSKFPVYVVPNLSKMIADGKDLNRVAFLIAAYRDYLKYHTDVNGEQFEVNDPWLTDNDKELIASDNELDFLGLSPFGAVDLKGSEDFCKLYTDYCNKIRVDGKCGLTQEMLP